MPEKAKLLSPPYATFGSFLSFINKLRDTGIPNRIDPSVFGNASGSVSYSVIAALKFLNLIEEDGKPTARGAAVIGAEDEARKSILAATIRRSYGQIFDSIDLTKATAAEFDEQMRAQFDVQGSTVDKIAAFFIAAANHAGVELSPHLKARKAVSASTSSKKSSKQRKRDPEDDDDGDGGGGGGKLLDPPMTEKALEYRLVDLMKEASGDAEVMGAIIKVVTWLQTRDAR